MRFARVPVAAFAASLLIGGASAGRAETESCNPPNAKVVAAYKVDPSTPGRSVDQAQAGAEVELGNVIELKVEGLATLLDCLRSRAAEGSQLILFLANHPINRLLPIVDEKASLVRYKLSVTDVTRGVWSEILGRPGLSPRPISVSIGTDESHPLTSETSVNFRIIPTRYLLLGFGFLATLMSAFVWCARKTNIIRDPILNPVTGVVEGGRYSLSRTQAAWWFFIILASFILIASVTGDFNSTLNGTALALLGIGGGTLLGSAIIDASKEPVSEQKSAVAEMIAQDIARQEVNVDALKSQIAAVDRDTTSASRSAALSQAHTALADARKAYKRLTGQSVNFIQDLVSDVNGVSFHRFQMLAWTAVLSFIFLKEVYNNLAMPNFDNILLGLQSLSAATYLGLKIPEPTVPKT